MKSRRSPNFVTQSNISCKKPDVGGFSLIEVLVSIIILSFGLLGMVDLQASALQANRDARLQSVSTTLARELSDMMRGNKEIAKPTATVNPYMGMFSNPNGTAALAPATNSYCLNVGSSCTTPVDTAQAQMTDWLARVDAQLPGARVEVCPDPSPFNAQGIPQWSSCATSTTDPTAAVYIKIGWTRTSTNRSNTGTSALVKALSPSVVVSVSPGN